MHTWTQPQQSKVLPIAQHHTPAAPAGCLLPGVRVPVPYCVTYSTPTSLGTGLSGAAEDTGVQRGAPKQCVWTATEPGEAKALQAVLAHPLLQQRRTRLCNRSTVCLKPGCWAVCPQLDRGGRAAAGESRTPVSLVLCQGGVTTLLLPCTTTHCVRQKRAMRGPPCTGPLLQLHCPA